jgi:predicted molibdopterin-dependent oxidoreductase YjgC
MCRLQSPRTNARCTSRVWKKGARLSIKHDIIETVETAALDRMLKYHPKHCTYWLFSGDRHCSCGRDAALAELETLKTLAASGALKKV